MPAQRKSTALLDLSGAFKKNPKRGRARANEPQPEREIGSAPDTLTDDQRAAWDYFVDIAAPGVLTCQDRAYLETLAKEWTRYKNGEESSALVNTLLKLFAVGGFTPADRSRVSVKR